MIKAVIFDMDGLLINSEVVSYKVYNKILERYHQTLDLKTYAENYSGHTSADNMQNLITTYTLPLTIDQGLQLQDELENMLMLDGVELKAGAHELLQFLSDNHYQIALASSSHQERAIKMLAQNDIIQYFDSLTFGSEVKHGKPAPDIFNLAREKLGLAVDQCLILEDSEAGIQAAVNAQIPVVCIPDLKRPSQHYLQEAETVCASLDQVIPFFQM